MLYIFEGVFFSQEQLKHKKIDRNIDNDAMMIQTVHINSELGID